MTNYSTEHQLRTKLEMWNLAPHEITDTQEIANEVLQICTAPDAVLTPAIMLYLVYASDLIYHIRRREQRKDPEFTYGKEIQLGLEVGNTYTTAVMDVIFQKFSESEYTTLADAAASIALQPRFLDLRSRIFSISG